MRDDCGGVGEVVRRRRDWIVATGRWRREICSARVRVREREIAEQVLRDNPHERMGR